MVYMAYLPILPAELLPFYFEDQVFPFIRKPIFLQINLHMSEFFCTFAPAKVFETNTVAYRRKTERHNGNLAFALFEDSFQTWTL